MNLSNLFEAASLGGLRLPNRIVFPPIKTAFGTPAGNVTDMHLAYYGTIAAEGPAVIILEPVAVTADGKEHPKQLCIHLPDSASELKKIVDVIHGKQRFACLHLNHAGAAANPKASGGTPKAPSAVSCPASGQSAEALTFREIDAIVEAYRSAAEKAVIAGFDFIEIQGGHGYLLSQFLNRKINRREDAYGDHRGKFAENVLKAVKQGAPDMPLLLRISGSEMSPDFGISPDDLAPLLDLAEAFGICAVHVGMGSACFSPPWYFHHGSLPEKPQLDALAWVRSRTSLPVIAAGRMGRPEKINQVFEENLADWIALGRPLISDADLLVKWQDEKFEEVRACGYCLQGCLHRVKNGEPIGCNLNPEVGQPEVQPTDNPLKVLVAGGGPAGMSACLYLARRGHKVTLVEKENKLGGQFNLAWQAPGKDRMQEGLDNLVYYAQAHAEQVITGQIVDGELINRQKPDLLVWAVGARQNIPEIPGLEIQYTLTSIDYFQGLKPVKGKRILVIGAGRTGLEIAEKLGKEGYDVVATKRTDPIGSMMEMITRKLTLMRIERMPNVTLMPHTAVMAFETDSVSMEKDGAALEVDPFDTVILASGMLPAPGPDADVQQAAPAVEIIGDAEKVMDIYSAVHAGYALALKY